MYIFSKDGRGVINSCNISEFAVKEVIAEYDYPIQSNWCITADDCLLGEYSTGEEAKKELKSIIDSIIADAKTYQIE